MRGSRGDEGICASTDPFQNPFLVTLSRPCPRIPQRERGVLEFHQSALFAQVSTETAFSPIKSQEESVIDPFGQIVASSADPTLW